MKNTHLPYPHIYLSKTGMVIKKIKDENGKYFEVRVSDPIWIEEICKNLDDKSVTAQIGYFHLNEEEYLLAKREDYINIQNIVKFQAQGLDVMHTNVKDVVSHLRNEEIIAPKRYQHSKLGFDTYDSKMVFKHHKCIGLGFESTYNGNYAIKPKGSKEQWLKLFKQEVQGHAPLELICIISLSAAIVGYIGEFFGLDTIICHLTGNSTTGKSTAMKLAISMFGYPDVKENGLFTSYNSTANALIKALAGIKGIPVAFDEISMANTRDFNNLVYKLANGVDKNRLNKNSELRHKDTWLTTILSNGEEPIIQSSSNTGLYNRVFEFDNIGWTKDSRNAEMIKQVILRNYGHIGTEFVEYVMSKGRKSIIEVYRNWKQKVKEVFKQHNIKDNYTDRRVNNHAIFLTTAALFEQAFDLKLGMNEIIDLLIRIEKDSIENRNFDKTAIDYIHNFISMNIDKFDLYTRFVKYEFQPAKKEYWGKITVRESNIEVEINPLILEESLKKGGFRSSKVVLKELRDKGYLDHEKDKLYRKRLDNLGKLSKVYVILIKNEDEDEAIFQSINNLIDSITDSRKRSLLMKEKQRMKEELKALERL
jgi:putative DNA primase/helicase